MVPVALTPLAQRIGELITHSCFAMSPVNIPGLYSTHANSTRLIRPRRLLRWKTNSIPNGALVGLPRPLHHPRQQASGETPRSAIAQGSRQIALQAQGLDKTQNKGAAHLTRGTKQNTQNI